MSHGDYDCVCSYRCDEDAIGIWPLSPRHLNGSKINPSTWFEASGDPCILRADLRYEDAGRAHWFYAPYTCKYHMYSPHQMQQCLISKNISYWNMLGDSLNRDLYTWLGKLMSVIVEYLYV